MWPAKVQTQLWRAAGRQISFTSAVGASHYDVLGISRKATQAEVKAAYYKKSKLHHPDTTDSKGEGSEQFRLVNEAYEVLGNYKTRQLYDRGLHGHVRTVFEAKPKSKDEDLKMGFYKSRFTKENVPFYGKQNIYNFDEWTRQHYSGFFKNSMKSTHSNYSDSIGHMHHRGDINKSLNLAMQMCGFVGVLLFLISALSSPDKPNVDYISTRGVDSKKEEELGLDKLVKE